MEAAIIREILHTVLGAVTAFDTGAQGAAMAGLVMEAILEIVIKFTIIVVFHVAVSNIHNCTHL